MISYAAAGGSVGPHEDLYDVFLLQGPGRRRWQLSTRGDHAVAEGAPFKVLRNFSPEQELVLEPGDMLYLPPGVAHFGVALEPCMLTCDARTVRWFAKLFSARSLALPISPGAPALSLFYDLYRAGFLELGG